MEREIFNSASHSIPKTLSQSIYNYLKKSIINNKLKANQRINEKEIASIFGVSTTPVREAVLRLGAEGYITTNSHRESVVKEISYQELRDIFPVLAVLDDFAMSLVVDHISPEKIRELEEMTAKMERFCKQRSVEEYLGLNAAIHNKIWESLPNKILKRTLQFVHGQLLRYNYARYYIFRKPGVLKKSLKEHKEILYSLKSKNKEELKTKIQKHWSTLIEAPLRNELKEYFKNNERR